jgi:hypothetical protein
MSGNFMPRESKYAKESHLEASKMPKMCSPHPGTLEEKSHNPAWNTFSGRKNIEKWLIRS